MKRSSDYRANEAHQADLEKVKEEIISLWEHIEALSNSEKSREKSLWHM